MMHWAREPWAGDRLLSGPRRRPAAVGMVIVLAVAGTQAAPAAAQQTWDATVATTGGPGIANRVAPSIPRLPRRVVVPASVAARPANQVQGQPTDRRTWDSVPDAEPQDDPYPIPGHQEEPEDDTGVVVQPLRFAAPPLMGPEPSPERQGAWNAVVTGALGQKTAHGSAASFGQQFVGGTDRPASSDVAPHASDGPAVMAQNQSAAEPTVAAAQPGSRPVPEPAVAAGQAGNPPAANSEVPSQEGGAAEKSGEAVQPAAGAQAVPPLEPPVALREPQPRPLEALPPDASPVQQYCFNTADTAADARFAWQAKKIEEMEGELAKRVALLETKTEEFKSWLARRDEFSKKAQDKLVSFYTRMRPDAAALQLAAMDEETAAALLTKLEAKTASVVMGEMDPARAARIAAIISGAAKIPPPRPTAPASAKPQGASSAAPPQDRTNS